MKAKFSQPYKRVGGNNLGSFCPSELILSPQKAATVRHILGNRKQPSPNTESIGTLNFDI
jgi:hypothetical protein